MKKLVSGTALVGGLAVLAIAATALATPIMGVQGTNLGVGAFESLEAKTLTPQWQARIDTKGPTDVYVVENRIAPGGTFGWHSHPGPSIVVIKTGELTVYHGDDPSCTPMRFRRARALSTTEAMSTSCATRAWSTRSYT